MTNQARHLTRSALSRTAIFIVILGAAVFLPAGSLRFWQGWIFFVLYSLFSCWVTLYFLKHDPKLLERRLRGGPLAEKEPSQKLIQALAGASFIAELVIPGLDRRFHWSDVPPGLVLAGNAGIVVGLVIVFRTLLENSFASATVEVSENQRVISTGPYRIVRHPMYSGVLVMFLAIPLALGSYRALLVAPLMALVLVWRLVEEEKLLARRLSGYEEYRRTTRYRLIPFIW